MFQKKFILRRLLVSLGLGLLIGILVSEVPFLFLRETARAPRDITLTIPAGTSDQVARGEQPPSIPMNMTFVVGDTLIVNNQDSADHKLGPLWIPAYSTAQLSLEEEESFAFECTFQPGNYFGLDVREPLTLQTRIFGITYVALPMAVLIALYSLLLSPKKNENALA
ncbi:MAG: hypothetical protein M3Y68_02605 [Chloroflexota bacterium]|nr:hypothetical protein [Chloroflexota bacterium]